MDSSDLTVRLVEAVASQADVDPLELPPLHESIDVDALEALYDREGGVPNALAFEYAGYAVSICGDGSIELLGPEVDARRDEEPVPDAH